MSGKGAETRLSQRQMEREERKKREYGEEGDRGGHWKTWGRGVVRTSHTGRVRFGVGDVGEEIGGMGRW